MRGMNIFTSPESSMNEPSAGGHSLLEVPDPAPPESIPGADQGASGSILNEVLDEWNISMKFKQLDLEMKNLIEKHSWKDDQEREINYDDVRRRHQLLPANPRKELKDMLRRFEEEERNGFGLGMSCPVRANGLLRNQSDQEKEIESENRIEAIFEKYKVRDFSDEEGGRKEPESGEEGDLLEVKERVRPPKCSIAVKMGGEEHARERDREPVGSPEKRDIIAMHSDVDKIMNQCLNSQNILPENRRGLGFDLENLDDECIVQTSQDRVDYGNILAELEEPSVQRENSNFLDVRESINKIRLGQSDLFPRSKVLSPIAKKHVM